MLEYSWLEFPQKEGKKGLIDLFWVVLDEQKGQLTTEKEKAKYNNYSHDTAWLHRS